MDRILKLALVGAGMFGGDVHLRVFADLQRFGLAGQLARLGFEAWTRKLAPVQFELAAVGTRSAASARRAIEAYARTTSSTPRAVMTPVTPDHQSASLKPATLERRSGAAVRSRDLVSPSFHSSFA